MKILFDSQIFGMQDYGGISRYYAELINHLTSKNTQVLTPPIIHNNQYLKNRKQWIKDRLITNFKYKNYVYTVINSIIQIPTILKNNYDIIHPTYYEIIYPRIFVNKKLVITVYDLIHEKVGERYPGLSHTISQKKKIYLERADKIIAISKNTKNDIVDIYKISPEKIDVVYLGNSLSTWDKKKKLKLPDRYILFVGQRKYYKNFANFLKSASKLTNKYTDLNVVCVGGGEFTQEESQLISNSHLDGKLLNIPFSTDRDLSEIYGRAQVFVYPSIYEGFGIPILEAFVNKCPIAISNTSCFPEIAQNAAIYFDPEEVNSMVFAIDKLLKNDSLRNKLIVRGTKRLRHFSNDKTAKETLKIYKKLIGQKI